MRSEVSQIDEKLTSGPIFATFLPPCDFATKVERDQLVYYQENLLLPGGHYELHRFALGSQRGDSVTQNGEGALQRMPDSSL